MCGAAAGKADPLIRYGCPVVSVDKCLLPIIVVSGVIRAKIIIRVCIVAVVWNFIGCKRVKYLAALLSCEGCITDTVQESVFYLCPRTAKQTGRGGADSGNVDGAHGIDAVQYPPGADGVAAALRTS